MASWINKYDVDDNDDEIHGQTIGTHWTTVIMFTSYISILLVWGRPHFSKFGLVGHLEDGHTSQLSYW